jgi:hypothetical protein
MLDAWIFALVWISGALVGAFVTAIYTWWALATGRRTVRPLIKPTASAPREEEGS